MIIKILGSGCKKCVALGENAKAAAVAAGKEAEIVKVTDFAEIAAYDARTAGRCQPRKADQILCLGKRHARLKPAGLVTHRGAFLPGAIGVMACGPGAIGRTLTTERITERAGDLLNAEQLLVSDFPPGASEERNSVIGHVVCKLARRGFCCSFRVVMAARDSLRLRQPAAQVRLCCTTGGIGVRCGVRRQPDAPPGPEMGWLSLWA